MFDLENAIKSWKKDLAENQALEDTYISELEAGLRDEVADLVRRGESGKRPSAGPSSEMGESRDDRSEFSKVRRPSAGARSCVGWSSLPFLGTMSASPCARSGARKAIPSSTSPAWPWAWPAPS